MKVFKACMIVVRRRYAAFLLYFAVFITLSVIMSSFYQVQFSTDFATTKPNFTVIDRDGGSRLTEGLTSYLREHGSEVVLEDDKSALQDAAFFLATDYIVILPTGFRDAFMSGKPVTLEAVKTNNTAKGYYAESMVNQYLNLARVYLTADGGLNESELVSSVLSDLALQADAVRKNFGESAPLSENYVVYMRMMPYILLVLIIICVTNLTMTFRRPDIRMRNLCAPLMQRSSSGQQVLACGILSVFAWLLLTATAFIMYGSALAEADGRMIALILINSLCFTAVSLALATLSGTFVRSANAQNAVANVMSLCLCFLGGIFVPIELLGDGVLAFARFLPTYWNVTALYDIGKLTSFDGGSLNHIWQSMIIQLAFAAAFFCVALAVIKQQSQSERFFVSTRTEIEA